MIRSQLPAGPVSGLAFLSGGDLLAVTPAGLFRSGFGEWELVAEGPGAGRVALHPAGEIAVWTLDYPPRSPSFALTRLSTGEPIRRLHPTWIQPQFEIELSFTPDGSEFRARYTDMHRWSVGDWRMLDAIPTMCNNRETRSARGHLFTNQIGSPTWWSLTDPSGAVTAREKSHRRPIATAAFSPDSGTIFLAQKSRIRRLNADSGAELEPRNWGLSGVTALAVSADGLTAAMGTRTGDVVVWDEC